MRHRGTSIVAAVIGVVWSSPASACTCVLKDAPFILERVPIVFVAEVAEVKGSRVVLGAVESFKGQAPREVTQGGREFSCHPELKKGARALFLLNEANQVVGLCNTVQGREDLVSDLRRSVGRKK